MRKHIVAVVLALVLGFGLSSAQAKENPVDQLTGKIWMESSQEIKEAVLLGADCVVAIEHFVAKGMENASKDAKNVKQAKKTAPKAVSTLSPFEKAWAKAFNGVSRQEIVQQVDAWYTAHPDDLARPVFGVIWFEIIIPKLQQQG